MFPSTDLCVIGGVLRDKDPQQLIRKGVIEGLLVKPSHRRLPTGVRTGPNEIHQGIDGLTDVIEGLHPPHKIFSSDRRFTRKPMMISRDIEGTATTWKSASLNDSLQKFIFEEALAQFARNGIKPPIKRFEIDDRLP